MPFRITVLNKLTSTFTNMHQPTLTLLGKQRGSSSAIRFSKIPSNHVSPAMLSAAPKPDSTACYTPNILGDFALPSKLRANSQSVDYCKSTLSQAFSAHFEVLLSHDPTSSHPCNNRPSQPFSRGCERGKHVANKERDLWCKII